MDRVPVIAARGVNHFYGKGRLRRQVLFDIELDVQPGEIVLMTGPSGSGKTTLLTLLGALRSPQEGSLRVLGEELLGASESGRVRVRRRIGYVFQAHNLIETLSVRQNVAMAHSSSSGASNGRLGEELLEAVGLTALRDASVGDLSGGQRQRVAVARALAGDPRLVLADEPTASLDRAAGRGVVEQLRDLARRRGSAVILCTHDNRILDVADRIVHMDDGRLTSFTSAVANNTRQLLESLARSNRSGELARQVEELPVPEFSHLLERVTEEFRELLSVLEISQTEAFESMLGQVIEAFTLKIGQVLRADRATLFLVDVERGELWSKVAQAPGEKHLEIRIPITTGIAGHVARTGEPFNTSDAYSEPLFNREVDRETGYRTRSLLCMPIADSKQRVFAVVQLLNKDGGSPFGDADEQSFRDFASSIGVILESWTRMRSGRLATPAVEPPR
jgi:putative ABC transport system ATP-binding protein